MVTIATKYYTQNVQRLIFYNIWKKIMIIGLIVFEKCEFKNTLKNGRQVP